VLKSVVADTVTHMVELCQRVRGMARTAQTSDRPNIEDTLEQAALPGRPKGHAGKTIIAVALL
jgi:hypothetical protein